MKLAELFQGPRPTSSSLPRGGARGEVPDGKTSDFADALSVARKKPEPKATETEKPVARKHSATRKGKAAPADAQPADEVGAADETSQVDEAPPAAVDESNVDDDQSPNVEDHSEAPVESEPDEAVADAAAMALAQATIPQTPVVTDEQAAEGEVENASLQPQMICPPKLNQPAQPSAANKDAESETDADVASGVSDVLLEGMEKVSDSEGEPLPEELDLDTAPAGEPVAKTPVKPHAPAASVKPVDAADPTDAPKTEAKETDDAQATPSLTDQLAMNADAAVNEEPVAPTSHVQADASESTATISAHVQPEPAKVQPAPQGSAAQAPAPLPPQAHFVEANHPKIVSAVQAQALTNGGSMQIRLDPPELGALQVMVHMQDGVMTASFHTSNDDATKLLSHSLSQLKQVLESQGVSVERLQVQQAPKDQHAQHDDPQQQQRDQHGDAHRQEQQRKEMLRRMWRRLSNGSDPLDLVA